MKQSPAKKLKISEQREVELREAEQMQAKAHELGETFVTGKRLCEDPELNGVLEKAKKKRKRGRLASDDSMYRDTIEEIGENLVIDEKPEAKPETGKSYFISFPTRVPGLVVCQAKA